MYELTLDLFGFACWKFKWQKIVWNGILFHEFSSWYLPSENGSGVFIAPKTAVLPSENNTHSLYLYYQNSRWHSFLAKMPAELPSIEQIFTETSRLVPLKRFHNLSLIVSGVGNCRACYLFFLPCAGVHVTGCLKAWESEVIFLDTVCNSLFSPLLNRQ